MFNHTNERFGQIDSLNHRQTTASNPLLSDASNFGDWLPHPAHVPSSRWDNAPNFQINAPLVDPRNIIINPDSFTQGCEQKLNLDTLFKEPDREPWGVTTGSDGRLGSAFRLADIPIFAPSPQEDADGDSLNDRWENLAVQQLNPVLEHDENELLFKHPEHKLVNFTRVTPTTINGEQYIAFMHCATYTKDYGVKPFFRRRGDHNGDTQEFQVLWKVTDPNTIELDSLFTSGHAPLGSKRGLISRWIDKIIPGPDTVPDFGFIGRAIGVAGVKAFEPKMTSRENIELTSTGQVKVYMEENKHATWPSKSTCEQEGPYDCGWNSSDPGGFVRPQAYNVGEPNRPLMDYLDQNSEFPGEYVWNDPDGFMSKDVSSIGEKLSDQVRDVITIKRENSLWL